MADLLFSGVQPTNTPHIGNYIGALKQWADVQRAYRCLFCIVDLHAITVPQNPAVLRQNTLDAAATYLAIGLDPKRVTIFVQSDVSAHAELQWLLGTIVKMSELERMTQYKDKTRAKGENVSTGLFTYPVLMAADILLYDTAVVPVGEDQMQHVELTRMIARRFNTQFGETFTVPQALIQKVGARIMALDDPKVKMSKSGTVANYIALSEDADTIRKKIMRAVTDSGKGITYDPKTKPAVANLMTIYHHATGKTMEDIEDEFDGQGYGEFKTALAEAVIAMLEPIQAKLKEYQRDPAELNRILTAGAERATELAAKKMALVRDRMGIGRT
jgi:tryptophanyl-tRNA synthetase